MHANDYWIDIITLNHVIVYKCSILEHTWNHTTARKLFELDQNSRYYNCVQEIKI